MTSISPDPDRSAPARSAPAYCVALPLLLVACVCSAACQARVPASSSTDPASELNSTTAAPQTPTTTDDSPPAPVPPSTDTVTPEPEIPPVPVADEGPPPQRDDQAVPITFDDLKLDMEKDTVYDPSMLTDRVKELEGRRVRIRGFIFPSVFQLTGITSFPLIKNLQCKFGPGGQAHHIVLVEMKPGLSTDFTVRPIAVEGILTVKPWNGPDGNTWALYHMVGDAVE